jgi:hypothetical protein
MRIKLADSGRLGNGKKGCAAKANIRPPHADLPDIDMEHVNINE